MGLCKNILHGIALVLLDGADVGYTEGGVEVEKTMEIFEKEVDQELDACDVAVTKYTMVVRTTFAEDTLENIKRAWNESSTITTVTGPPAYRELKFGVQQEIPEHELIFIGYSPDKLQRKYVFYRAKRITASAKSLKKGEKTVIPVEFRCLADFTKPAGEEYGYVKDYTS